MSPGRALWIRRLGPLYPLAVAVQFLTRVPMPRRLDPGGPDLAAAAPFFPAVGILVGGTLGVLAWALLSTALAPGVVAVALLPIAVLLTGGFHEDGLADTADGIGGGATRDDRLRIMRDSRIGSYGGLALVLLLLARFGCLLGTRPEFWPIALLVAHTIGRWSSLVLLTTERYARDSGAGAGKPMVDGLTGAGLLAGTGIAAATAIAGEPRTGAIALAVAAALTLGASRYFRARLGGITGDALGATNVVCEVAVLGCFAAAYPALQSPWIGG